MKEDKKKEKEIYCSLEYFMKYGCVGCKLSRKCEEYENKTKLNYARRAGWCKGNISVSVVEDEGSIPSPATNK